jgi:hypothetical protein
MLKKCEAIEIRVCGLGPASLSSETQSRSCHMVAREANQGCPCLGDARACTILCQDLLGAITDLSVLFARSAIYARAAFVVGVDL